MLARVPSRFQRAAVVANPIAGRGRARARAEELVRELARVEIAAELHYTSGRGDARAWTREHAGAFDVVVAVGGDGTVSEVLDGVPEAEMPVAILAMGTANVMSIDLGLPRDPAGVARMVASGRTTTVDVARVNGTRLSFLVVGAGVDAQVVRELERLRKGPITKRTWARAALRVLLACPTPRLSVAIDGRAIEGEHCQVLFSNVVHYAGFRVLASDRVLDDGRWEVYLFPAGSRVRTVLYGVRALLGGFPSGRVRRERGTKLEVRSASPVPFQVDGDLAGETPFAIEVEPVRRRLVLP